FVVYGPGGGPEEGRGARTDRPPPRNAPPPPPIKDDDRASLVLLAPQLLEPRVAATIEAIKFIANGILQVVVLMVFLGFVERPGRHDLGCNRLLEALLDNRLRGFRLRTLLLAAIKDRAAVLVAVVAELPILRQRIDIVPEHVEQPAIAHLRRIVHDLHRLGMAGTAMRDLLIGRIGRMTTGIARGRADHALDLVKIGLYA